MSSPALCSSSSLLFWATLQSPTSWWQARTWLGSATPAALTTETPGVLRLTSPRGSSETPSKVPSCPSFLLKYWRVFFMSLVLSYCSSKSSVKYQVTASLNNSLTFRLWDLLSNTHHLDCDRLHFCSTSCFATSPLSVNRKYSQCISLISRLQLFSLTVSVSLTAISQHAKLSINNIFLILLRSWMAEILTLRSCTFILPSSNWKCFQTVLFFQNQSNLLLVVTKPESDCCRLLFKTTEKMKIKKKSRQLWD